MRITALSRLRKVIRDKEDPFEFFTDPVFNNTLNGVAKIVSERYGNFPIFVQLEWNNGDERIAQTNNRNIYINLDNQLVHAVDGIDQKYVAYLGFLGHELGHVLYTDFSVTQKQMELLYTEKRWYPNRPQNANVDEFESYCFSGKIPPSLFAQVFHAISNIVEDYYVNYKMCREWPGLFKQGIEQTQAIMWKQYPKPDEEIMTGLSGCINTFHQLLVQYDCPTELKKRYPMLKGIEKVGQHIVGMDDYRDRAMLCNELLLLMWQELKNFIDEHCQQQQQNSQGDQPGEGDNSQEGNGKCVGSSRQSNGNSKSTSGDNEDDNEADDSESSGEESGEDKDNSENRATGNKSGDAPQGESEEELNNESLDDDCGNSQGEQQSADNRSGSSNDHKEDLFDSTLCEGIQSGSNIGSGKGVMVGENSEKNQSIDEKGTDNNSSDPQDDNASDSSDSENDDGLLDQILRDAIDEYLQELARKDQEKIQQMERELTVQDTATGIHSCVRYSLNVMSNSLYQKEAYDRYSYNLKRVSKRMQSAIADVFEERLNGTIENGLLFGNRINPAASASGDGRVFRRRTMPDDSVDIAVSLLIDQSGSMSGNRIAKAMEMAILVEDFCRGLGIPVSIVGHNVTNQVQMYQYIDFDDTSKNGRYSLLRMSAEGCNRDGLPLRYCVNRLLQRSEENKLMILVSDGKPNDDGYRGVQAYDDLRQVKRDCDRKGIILLAAAIGEDKEQIHAIYGNSFLDITDLNTLPIKIVRTIKQFI